MASSPVGYIPLPPEANTGRWYRVRLQIFPDGRCGIAVDGKPLGIDATLRRLDRPAWLVVYGNSIGTRMLVGPLEVWEGVKEGVDWGRLSRDGDSRLSHATCSGRNCFPVQHLTPGRR